MLLEYFFGQDIQFPLGHETHKIKKVKKMCTKRNLTISILGKTQERRYLVYHKFYSIRIDVTLSGGGDLT